jgi:hypothetical protein
MINRLIKIIAVITDNIELILNKINLKIPQIPIFISHSHRNASAGLSFAARAAGYTPEHTPTRVDTPNASTT